MECYLCAAQQLCFDTVFAIYFVYSVLAVAKNWQTYVRQMSTYLVCTSGNKFHFQQRKFAKVFKQFVMRFNRNITRLFNVAYVHQTFFGVLKQIRFKFRNGGLWIAHNNTVVRFVYVFFFERLQQFRFRRFVESKNHQSHCVSVQTVHRHCRGVHQNVVYPFGERVLALHFYAGHFVYHQNVVVTVDNFYAVLFSVCQIDVHDVACVDVHVYAHTNTVYFYTFCFDYFLNSVITQTGIFQYCVGQQLTGFNFYFFKHICIISNNIGKCKHILPTK
ncbi:unknown [Corallococcus sp. CAG:1435]|nr:unknown [Corallococcus sp. CAG:1435]